MSHNFEPDQLLFRRCDPAHVLDNGEVLVEAFRFPDLSVVRSVGPAATDVYQPTDALWASEQDPPADGQLYAAGLSVVAFPVSAIPVEVVRENAAPYQTKVEHCPYPDLYPHSEARVFKDGVRVVGGESKIKGAARRLLREAIAAKAKQVLVGSGTPSLADGDVEPA